MLIMNENKEFYVIPAISIVELKQEGVICTSTDLQDYDWNEYIEE